MRPVSARPWFGPLVAGAAFVVTLLAFAPIALVTDIALRQAEMEQLVTRVEASESQMVAVQEEIGAITDEYESLSDPNDEDRAELVGQLADAAAYGQEAIAEAGAVVASDTYLPWHTAILRAQQDYLAHNQAWQDYLEAAAVDPGELTMPQEDIDSTFVEAEESMRAALPPLASDDLRQRLELIFAEPEGEGGQAT
jgi:hypothetical protein